MNFSNMWELLHAVSAQALVRIVDIAVVSYITYRLLLLARGSRALQIIIGFGLFIAALLISEWLGLTTLHWLLDKATTLGPVALVFLFYPELRQVLEHFGRLQFLRSSIGSLAEERKTQIVEDIIAAVSAMAKDNIGALIVFERISRLDSIIETGVSLNATLNPQLLNTIFFPKSPLHDGAVIIRGDKIIGAACRLPMSENQLDPAVHMRHRAAVGITEESDALCIIVSEERGQISVAAEGELKRGLSPDQLRDLLFQVYRKPTAPLAPLLKLFKGVDKAVAKVKRGGHA